MNLVRYSTGKIPLSEHGKSIIKTPLIIGKILKVSIEYKEKGAEDLILEAWTSDKEKFMAIQGAKDGLWYPRNWNVQAQQYLGVTDAPEGSGALAAEPYVSAGPITISIQGSMAEDYIKNIIFLIDGKVIKMPQIPQDIIKEDAPVTTNTPGVFNPTHDRRRKHLHAYMKNILMDITKNFDEQQTIVKADSDELRRFIETSLYTRTFDGVDKTKSDLIKDFILRSIVKGYPKERVMTYLQNKGLSKVQANNIYRTENQALRTKVREWSYLKIDPEGQLKYKWIGPSDTRTTEICNNLEDRTKKGVTLNRLKEMIIDEVNKAKERKELPSNFDPREYTPHFGCRHTFVRLY